MSEHLGLEPCPHCGEPMQRRETGESGAGEQVPGHAEYECVNPECPGKKTDMAAADEP